jgi:hypothetical protein
MFLAGGDACNQSVGSSIEVYETWRGPTRNIYLTRFVYPWGTEQCRDRSNGSMEISKNARKQGKGKVDTEISNG